MRHPATVALALALFSLAPLPLPFPLPLPLPIPPAAAAGEEPPRPGPLARQAAADRAALETAGLERTTFEEEDRRLAVWRGGAGPHLVLLHGSGHHAGAWAGVAPGLAERFTVHVLDLPGHGASAPAEGLLPMAEVVGGVESYLAALDGPAILVGNSLGAWLATLMAQRHPERVTRAVLVNGGALLNVPAEGLTLTPTDREQARRVMAAIRDPASPPLSDAALDEIVERSQSGPTPRLMQDMPGLLAHLLDGRLGEVTVPVEIVWGASDGLMPLAYAERMEEQLPRARLTVIESCGHIPPAECPERLLAVLRELLAAEPPVIGSAPPAAEPPGVAEESEPAADAGSGEGDG